MTKAVLLCEPAAFNVSVAAAHPERKSCMRGTSGDDAAVWLPHNGVHGRWTMGG
jgi:hypothetical protein